MQRRRFKQTTSLEERLLRQAEEIRIAADKLPPGEERDALLKKAKDATMAVQIEGWLRSPGLPSAKTTLRK